MATLITATEGQRKQAKRLLEDAIDRMLAEGILDKDGFQKLIESGGEFQKSVIDVAAQIAADEQFSDEGYDSDCTYPRSYKARPLAEQVKILRKAFPELGDFFVVPEGPLPFRAEEWFAVPRWRLLALTYGQAVKRVFEAIRGKRILSSHCIEGAASLENLRQNAETITACEKIADQQTENDILIVPCQTGLYYRGLSVRRARKLMLPAEFALDTFSVGCILLTHPERLTNRGGHVLHISIAGDVFPPGAVAGNMFSHIPAYPLFHCDEFLTFDVGYDDNPNENYGLATGFLPKM